MKCFLVSTVSVKPLLHTLLNYAINFFTVEGENGMLLNCHISQLSIFRFEGNKKHPYDCGRSIDLKIFEKLFSIQEHNYLIIDKEINKETKKVLKKYKNVFFVEGSSSRQKSAFNALKFFSISLSLF